MYRLLLCLRYLRTRHIALASIISVTLGVATMIVVNAVMAGFTTEMQDRIHGILSDVVFESRSLDGFEDPVAHMQEIQAVAGKFLVGMTPTVHVPAMLSFDVGGQNITKQVTLVGVEATSHDRVSDFSRFLQHPGNRQQLSFDLREAGYDLRDHTLGSDGPKRPDMQFAGWIHRRAMAPIWAAELKQARQTAAAATAELEVQDPFAANVPEGPVFDPASQQHPGAVLGIALASYRDRHATERFLFKPGDDIKLSYPTGGSQPKVQQDLFTVVDFYESKMSEYDAGFVFVPLQVLQQMRGMFNPQTGKGLVNAIQIKLKPGIKPEEVRDLLQTQFRPEVYVVSTWKDKQGPLLAAVAMETTLLNILLFLIIAVAGFGILAIFYMIVVEKTRDIGILKSLGAPQGGVLSIFLTYGLSLGVVGAGGGLILGLLFVANINHVADAIGWITGREVFDPSIYYFRKIPTIIRPLTVAWIVAGALAIAVLASILPARHAARLHPVEALRA